MPSWGPLGQQVFNRTYSRPTAEGSESWQQTVSRVVEGNLDLVDAQHIEPLEATNLARHFENFSALPAGRHLWVSGVPGRQFLFNCHRSGFGPNLADHFCFTFDELMKGGGVGSNYSDSYLEKFPSPAGRVELAVMVTPSHPDRDEFAHHLVPSLRDGEVYKVPDSRQGWVEALRRVITLFEDGGGYINIDVSDVRPRGAPILGFGGTASGPGPLVEMLVGVSDILNDKAGRDLNSLDVMEIDHQIASCVVAGNVRRSARMSIKHWNDPDIFDFISCKSDPNEHWSTNISVEIDALFLDRIRTAGPNHAKAVFEAVIDGMIANGEPGFYNSQLAAVGEVGDVRSTNPCGEIALEDFEPCNLGHINLAAHGTDVVGAAEAARLMTRFLIRATFGDVENHRQRMVLDRNRRIGVGLFGVQEWAAAHGIPWSDIASSRELAAFLCTMSEVVEAEADAYSKELGIPRPIKTRTIAPTGTIAKLPGVTEGIHPIYARHFVQRIRYAQNDPMLQVEIDKGRHVEDCIYTAGTAVVSVPTRNAILDKFDQELIEDVSEIHIDDLFRVQAFFQQHWADNAVSFTANIDPDTKAEELSSVLGKWLEHLKGTTVFPDLSRPQSPYERIDATTFEELTAGSAVETGQDFDECANGACPVR